MNKYQIIALMGESGSGKDTVLNVNIKEHPNLFHKIITNTTRPMRDYEKDGVNYHFLSIEQFTRKVLNGEMLEATEFNGWLYGSSIDALKRDKINLGVFTPTGIEALMENPDIDLSVIWVQADDKTRLLRCLNREENPDCVEICRRYFADLKDFEKAEDLPYAELYNTEHTPLEHLDLCGLPYFSMTVKDMESRLGR